MDTDAFGHQRIRPDVKLIKIRLYAVYYMLSL